MLRMEGGGRQTRSLNWYCCFPVDHMETGRHKCCFEVWESQQRKPETIFRLREGNRRTDSSYYHDIHTCVYFDTFLQKFVFSAWGAYGVSMHEDSIRVHIEHWRMFQKCRIDLVEVNCRKVFSVFGWMTVCVFSRLRLLWNTCLDYAHSETSSHF